MWPVRCRRAKSPAEIEKACRNRKGLPKSKKLSAAEIARLKREHAETIVPARQAATEILGMECRLSSLVNDAYSLTPEEVALMWGTASPHMPFSEPA